MKDSRDAAQIALFDLPVRAKRVRGPRAKRPPMPAALSTAQQAALTALQRIGPVDDETLQSWYNAHHVAMGLPPQRCIRKRRKELVDLGHARDVGSKTANAVGVLVRQWDVTRRYG